MTRGQPSCEAYKWLQKVIQTYGVDGMSSEESDNDGDDIIPTLRVKVMPWRRSIDNELEIIDKQRKKVEAFHNQGSRPMKRERRHAGDVQSTRPPVPDLPRSFYRREWLASLGEDELVALGISEEDFPWLNIAEETSSL